MLGLVAIAGLSACMILFGLFADPIRDRNRGRYLIATSEVEVIAEALEHYRADCGEYPSSAEGLNGLIVDDGVDGWQGPYLKTPREKLIDPWGRLFVYSLSAGAPEILSFGADGEPGGRFFNTDISSRNPRYSMPESPYERRLRLKLIATWIGAWLGLIGSISVLRKASRGQRGRLVKS